MGNKVAALTIELNLSNKHLEEIPMKPLKDFIQLRVVKLSHNEIVSIPQAIAKDIPETPRFCDNLEVLDLHHNKLTKLPNEICLLVNLKKFRLDHNQLKKLPRDFSALFQLEKLTLDHNLLTKLPANMENMKKLKVLRLDSNQLTYIPNDIGRITTLKELTIHNNPLPEKLLDLFELESVLKYLAQQKVPETYLKEKKLIKQKKIKFEAKDDLGQQAAILKRVLSEPKARQSFRNYLMEEVASENLEFWEAVEKFKSTFNSDLEVQTKQLISDANKIYYQFIDDKATSPINIPGDVKEKIQRIWRDEYNFPKGVNQWVFNEAQASIFKLMYSDSFHRYSQTEEGRKIVALYGKNSSKESNNNKAKRNDT
jgi:Leucine-rich repeat (LRR) protein